MDIKTFFKKLIPPLFLEVYHSLRKNHDSHSTTVLSWSGNYSSWEEAGKHADGYDSIQILEKVKRAALEVKNGHAAFERDSILFEKPEYNWSLLTCIFSIAAQYQNKIDLLDFGGSLGSSYFQNIHFLNLLDSLHWSVVEQPGFIHFGNEKIADTRLRFYESMEKVFQERHPEVFFSSCVIQYLDDPYTWIRKFMDIGFKYMILERISFIEDSDDRITVQNIPEFIYKASYPAWFFNKEKFLNNFSDRYELFVEFEDRITAPSYLEDMKKVYWSGFIFKKR